MTFADAAATVLRNAQRPMSTEEITERALAHGLLNTTGKTPVATMAAALYRLGSNDPIQRVYEPGPARAARGSVRWAYVER